jgi:hypothetical protein
MKIIIINLAAGKMASCFKLVTTLKEAVKLLAPEFYI